MNLEWTDERVELLRKRWSEGHSGSVIGDELGVSRCSVLGKAFRLGLPSRNPSVRAHSKRRTKASKSPWFKQMAERPEAPKREPKRTYKIGPDPWTPRDVEEIPEADRVSLLDLTDKHCRYPFGEGRDIAFCGRDRVPGVSYCASHARTCYTEHSVKLAEVLTDTSKNPEPENMGKSHVLEAVS